MSKIIQTVLSEFNIIIIEKKFIPAKARRAAGRLGVAGIRASNILYLTEQYTNQSLTAAAVALTHSEYNLSHICPRHAPAEFATALQGCMS
ncbi:hypothetical protein J6A32_10280, partial [Methanocorpusculum sp.]|nr:hypothetical protein [Methanocorpusculum sp.]